MENIETTSTAPVAPSAEFFAELAKAQAEFLPVRKNKLNPATKSKYADLQSVFDAVKPALNAHGFFIFQRVTSSADSVSAETLLGHKSGETLSSGILTVPYMGLQNRGTNSAQALGSARTYACRYSICSFLCVVAEDDDDGNAASEPRDAAPAPAPAPERPVVSQELRNASSAAAAKGLAAYEAYYKSLDLQTRKLLIDTGVHVHNKAAAAAVNGRETSHVE